MEFPFHYIIEYETKLNILTIDINLPKSIREYEITDLVHFVKFVLMQKNYKPPIGKILRATIIYERNWMDDLLDKIAENAYENDISIDLPKGGKYD